MHPRALLVASALLLGACAHGPTLPADAPLPGLELASRSGGGDDGSRCLVVFLPGLGDDAQAFADHGFDTTLSSHGIDADLWAVDWRGVGLGHPELAERLARDVRRRTAEKGYAKTWLVGVSLGGGGALHTSAETPELVDGVVALSPVFADPFLVKDIRRRGGLHAWSPERPDHPSERVFDWLRHRQRPGGGQVPVFLGYAADDPLAPIFQTVADALEPGRVVVGGGGHAWNVWRELWQGFVASGRLQRSCGVR